MNQHILSIICDHLSQVSVGPHLKVISHLGKWHFETSWVVVRITPNIQTHYFKWIVFSQLYPIRIFPFLTVFPSWCIHDPWQCHWSVLVNNNFNQDITVILDDFLPSLLAERNYMSLYWPPYNSHNSKKCVTKQSFYWSVMIMWM